MCIIHSVCSICNDNILYRPGILDKLTYYNIYIYIYIYIYISSSSISSSSSSISDSGISSVSV